MPRLADRIRSLFSRPAKPSCDTCVHVQFFRSNGDGQVPRLHAFCRCPAGPFQDKPTPRERRCDHWQRRSTPVEKPVVGDPTLTV